MVTITNEQRPFVTLSAIITRYSKNNIPPVYKMLYRLFAKKGSLFTAFVRNRAANKLLMLFLSFIFYGFVYFVFCHDSEFGGINILQDYLKRELVAKYVEKVKKQDISQHAEDKIASKIQKGEVNPETDTQFKRDVDADVENVEEEVTSKNLFQQFYDRFYFSVVTGTTLGYGDIYPVSNKVKFLTLCQVMTTIYVLVS